MRNIKQCVGDTINRIIKSNETIHKTSLKLYREYSNIKPKREFYSRIKELNPDKYLDTTNKPDLNVIVLTIDCLRNSQLSFQGYQRETTPFLDTFESKFKAISASSWTYPSVASILTGLYPHNHNAILRGEIKNFGPPKNFQRIRSDVLTLPEILFLLGYKIYFGTAIDLAFFPLRARTIRRVYTSPNAENLLNDLMKWISRDDKQFFAYLQLGDIHQPLTPPNNFKFFFDTVDNIPGIDMWDFRRPEEQKGKKFQEYKENRILLYDNTLRYIDWAIEQFYGYLENSGLIDSTILIITADHGDEFWEHAELEAKNFYDPRGFSGVGHGHNVFNEIIEVPILISGIDIPNTKSEGLSTTDITPTIIDLLGIDHKLKFDGRNAFENKGGRVLLSEAMGCGYEKKALIFGKYKLVYSKDDEVTWVFDLKKDPEEQHPIVDKAVTSIFVDKLAQIFREDEKRKVRKVIKRKIKSIRDH